MTCYIIDDEPLAAEVLKAHIARVEGLQLKGVYHSALKALEAIASQQVDLIFLDIKMPHLSGVELVKLLCNKPYVIFTTAHMEHAWQGYELDVTDYLLKPISFERFLGALTKVYRLQNTLLPALNTAPASADSALYIKTYKKVEKVVLDEILYIESLRNYVRIHRVGQAPLISHDTLTNFSSKVPGLQFLQIHRSYIINTSQVKSFTNNQVEVGKVTLPIGKLYKSDCAIRLSALQKSH